MPAGGLPASGTSARAGDSSARTAADSAPLTRSASGTVAGGEHHAVVEQRLDQALAQQVGLPGGRRPAAGPVDQVEVVEGLQRVAGEPRRPRGERGDVGGGGAPADQAEVLGGEAAQQLGGARGAPGRGKGAAQPAGRPGAARRLRVAAAQQLAAVPARGERRGRRRGRGGRRSRTRTASRRRRARWPRIRPSTSTRWPGAVGRAHDVLDAEPAGDLGGHHDVRMIGEPVGPRRHRHARLDQRGGDEAAVLAAGQAELDRAARVAQRRDRRDERLGDAPAPGRLPAVRPAVSRPGRPGRAKPPGRAAGPRDAEPSSSRSVVDPADGGHAR